jgi:RNA polymerase sigma-70 factor (ECF subfamily)
LISFLTSHIAQFGPVKNDLGFSAQRKSSSELAHCAQAGDESAFADLFHAHKTKVYRLCLRMTSNTAEAEDLTQEAFLQVFRKLAMFRGDSAISTWLYRVAFNTVLMHFRKKRLPQVSFDEPVTRGPSAPKREHGRIDGRLSSSVDRIALARAIKELAPGYRKIFLLHQVKGYEHHEIATLLRCSVGSSKSQLHKAKMRMRQLLSSQKPSTSKTVQKVTPISDTGIQIKTMAMRQSLSMPSLGKRA